MGGTTLWLLDHDPEAGLGFALRSLGAACGFETVVVPSPAGGLDAIAGEPSLIAGRVWLPSPLQGFEGCGGLKDPLGAARSGRVAAQLLIAASSRSRMPVIFISYRREDSAGHAGRLFDRLREHFGRDNVFLDVVGIDAGVDFVETLDKAVGSCDVLLAVIGREWLTCCDKQGRRRLDDPNDFIRAEISAALKRDVRVVPVLVEGAEMPPTDALPEELKRLTRRQAVEVRDSRWDADVEALIEALEKQAARAGTVQPPPVVPPAVRAEPAEPEAGSKPRRRSLLWGIGALAALLIAVGVALWSPWSRDETKLPPDGPKTGTEATPAPTGGNQTGGQTEESPSEPQTVSVPDLVGLSLEEASERLRVSGLVIGTQEAKKTADAPARHVIGQRPRPGEQLDLGTPVDLVYAEPLTDTRVEVPNVVGMEARKAAEVLINADFEVAHESEASAEPRNQVLRQEPAAGSRVGKGTRVTLVHAVPIATSEIPNVVGMDLRQAMDILRRGGFEFTRQSEPSAEAQNKVLRQEPAAGSRAEKGTQITLIYATGTTVFIHYADETDRRTAEGLASYLRSLSLAGIDYRVMLSKRGEAMGKLFYHSEGQADLATTIAGRSGFWLSKTYNRRVRIEPELDPNIKTTALWLTMPGSR